jgi:hypothetical protein
VLGKLCLTPPTGPCKLVSRQRSVNEIPAHLRHHSVPFPLATGAARVVKDRPIGGTAPLEMLTPLGTIGPVGERIYGLEAPSPRDPDHRSDLISQ